MFEKVYDDSTGTFYYFNAVSGESSWERPKLLGAHDDIQLTPRTQERWNEQHQAASREVGVAGDAGGNHATASTAQASLAPPDESTAASRFGGDQLIDLSRSVNGRALAQFRLAFDLGAFLEDHGLGRFEGPLIDEGFEDAEALLEASEEDLGAVGMRTGHKRVMLRALDALRESLRRAGVLLDDNGAVLRDPAAHGDTIAASAPQGVAVLGMLSGPSADEALPNAQRQPGGRGEAASDVTSRRTVAATQSPEASLHFLSEADEMPGTASQGVMVLGGLGEERTGAELLPDEAQRVRVPEERMPGSRGGASRRGSSRLDSRGDSRDGRRFHEAQANMGSEIVLEILLSGHDTELPGEGEIVRMHYEGRLPSGEVFESSRDRGRAFQFRLGAGQVIRGVEYAVAQLTRGCRARFRIPPELAYGTAGRLPKIPPNTALEFECQIIDFYPPDVDLTPRDTYDES